MTPSIFYSYITARKQNTTITNPNLSKVTGSGIYTYTGDLTIDSNSAPFNHSPGYNIVLVATGTVTVNPAPDNTFTPTGSVAIVAQTIKTGSPEYKAVYTPKPYALTPTTYLEYIKAHKQPKTINSLSSITSSGTYVISGDVSVDSNSAPFIRHITSFL